jgi:hypothetical protein
MMLATPRLTPDQIAQVSGLVTQYISAQREKYAPRAIPLSAQQQAALKGFFSSQVLDGTRLLVLRGERVGNPDFYPMLRGLGFNNLPDQSTMGAITFSDVGSYEAIPLEVNAYTLGGRFESKPQQVFSVDDEVRRWAAEGKL